LQSHSTFICHATASTDTFTLSLHDALPISATSSVSERVRIEKSPYRSFVVTFRAAWRSRRRCSERLAAIRRDRQAARNVTTKLRSEEHTSELPSLTKTLCRPLL